MFRSIQRDIQRYKRRPEDGPLLTGIKATYNHPSFVGIVWYRTGRFCWLRRRNPVCFVLFALNRALYPLIRIYSGLELSPYAEIGEGLWIGHFGPTVIHRDTKAGVDLTLLHGVTIGSAGGVPRLGDRVSVGAGATIIGDIVIGDDATIGAGAVVTNDIPSGCVATGVPAQAGQRHVLFKP